MEKAFIQSVLKNRVILSLGTKGSGKTYLMLNYLRYSLTHGLYDMYILVLPAYVIEQQDSYKFLKEFEQEKNVYIFDHYDEFITAQFLKDQENPKKEKLKTLYIIDDASGENIWNIDPHLKSLITVIRHLETTLWLLVHATSRILAPFLRSNTDILLLCKVTSYKLMENIYDEFLSLTPQYYGKKNQFISDFIELHKDKYQTMYIDMREDIIDMQAGNWKFNKKIALK